jgi:predicted 3-demethylubiquinone-9 3-methyltransferase (glyoxalase superfamily)
MADVQQIATMLMFTGQAEEAMTFYTGLFADSDIDFLQHYGPDYPGPEGEVVHARFRLAGRPFLAMDSHLDQPFDFNPRISFFVTCASAAEVDRLHGALSQGGSELMALDGYPFAERYAWVQDRFGVSWQLMFAGDRASGA